MKKFPLLILSEVFGAPDGVFAMPIDRKTEFFR